MQHEFLGIQAFIIISEQGSFTKASKILNLTQPALTLRIKKLEETLGAPLFERSTRNVQLSSMGSVFLPKAKSLLNHYQKSLESMRVFAQAESETISLSCIPTVSFYFLPSVIDSFNQHFPNIRLKIYEHTPDKSIEALRLGEVDFSINILTPELEAMGAHTLMTENFVLVCRQDHVLANKKQMYWKDLDTFPIIRARASSINRALIDNALNKYDINPNWFYEVSKLSNSLGMVERGLGLAIIPQSAIPKSGHPTLTSVPIVEPEITRSIGLTYNKNLPLSTAADNFKNIMLSFCYNLEFDNT